MAQLGKLYLWFIIIIALALYSVVARCVRFRRRDATTARFPTRASFKNMTVEDAFHIQANLAILEFPTVYPVSVFFALFKTYGIPSISTLLVRTGQLADETTASKRAADTGVILTEVVLHHPADNRAIEGIARMNYLHSSYRKAGKISDEDMLYTLSLFALEPTRWVERFEWRSLSEVELCAIGTYWSYMAAAMEIPLDLLKSSLAWQDGLEFLRELERWSLAYEERHMVPADSNRVMVNGTVAVGLFNVPRILHSLLIPVVSWILEPRVRAAMLLPTPSTWMCKLLDRVVATRRAILRYACLPRPYVLRDRWWSEGANSHGKYNAKQFISLPWYICPTAWARWGPKAWILRLVGGKVPGDHGDRYLPQGYSILEIGPGNFRGQGVSEMKSYCDHLRRTQRLQCPFAR